jgi:hypothetical protein
MDRLELRPRKLPFGDGKETYQTWLPKNPSIFSKKRFSKTESEIFLMRNNNADPLVKAVQDRRPKSPTKPRNTCSKMLEQTPA